MSTAKHSSLSRCRPHLVIWLSLALLQSVQADAIFHYNFDASADGSITTLNDISGNGLDAISAGPSSLSVFHDEADPGNDTGVLDARNDFAFGRLEHDDRLNTTGNFTLEVRVKPDNTTDPAAGGSEDHFIIHKMNNTGAGIFLSSYGLRYNQDTGHFGAIVGFEGGTGSGSLLTSDTAHREERWYHVAMVYSLNGNNSSVSLFVDGILEAEAQFNDRVLRFGTAPLFIGAGNFAGLSGTGQFRRNFIGLIDDIRLSDTDLAPHAFLFDGAAIPLPGTLLLFLAGWTSRRLHCAA